MPDQTTAVWIGRVEGEWLLYAFAEERLALNWASEYSNRPRTLQRYEPAGQPFRVKRETKVEYIKEPVE